MNYCNCGKTIDHRAKQCLDCYREKCAEKTRKSTTCACGGKKRSEAKTCITCHNRAKAKDPKFRQTLSAALKGKKKSVEHRKNLSKAKRGKCTGKNNPNWKGGLPEKNCLLCGEPITQHQRKRFCSRKCAGEWKSIFNNGKHNPNWHGGSSYTLYPKAFHHAKKLALERDEYTCKLCGGTENLHVHHIDYDKYNNDADNLVTLCRACHLPTNGNREFWKWWFTQEGDMPNVKETFLFDYSFLAMENEAVAQRINTLLS